jgi:O-antigen/teichoic acid export membrane protein
LSALPPSSLTGPVARLRQVLAVLRFRPFDCSTGAGRSQERYRRAALTTIMSVIGRGVTILTNLITVRVTLRYLGEERYGMWMTISSVVAMLSFTDLGISGGLVGAVAEALAKGQTQRAREYISSALVMLVLAAAAVLSIFMVAHPFVDWARIFNVSSPLARAEAPTAIIVLLLCQVASAVVSVGTAARTALQEGFANALWQSVGTVLALFAVLAAVAWRAPLAWLVLTASAAPIIGGVINGALLFARAHPEIRPRWRAVRLDSAKRLWQFGLLFFVLQCSTAIAFFSDNVVAAQVLGPSAVTQYAVPLRLFAIPMMIVSVIVAPLWPAYSESIARGDGAWVRRTLHRSLAFALTFSTVTSVLLVLFGNRLLLLWVGPQVQAPFWLLLGFAIWNILAAAGNTLSMFFNGARVFRFQVWTALTMAILNITLSILLARVIGLPGIIWGTVISYIACCAVPWFFFVPRLLRRFVNTDEPAVSPLAT